MRVRPNRGWIWFFAVLLLLTTAGITAEVWFNLHQQLTPEKLAQARRVWNENGPRDYHLEYIIKLEYNPDPAGTAALKYEVRVRDRKAIAVTTPEGQPLRPDEYEFDSMDSFFDYIDKRLREGAEPDKPRAFVKATFDEKDGHVVHYVHSVMRTRERLEIRTELTRD